MTRRASVVSCSMADCPSMQVVCVCMWGGGGAGVVKEGELTEGEEGGEVGGGGVKAG